VLVRRSSPFPVRQSAVTHFCTHCRRMLVHVSANDVFCTAVGAARVLDTEAAVTINKAVEDFILDAIEDLKVS
jgi:hypothetical protein